MAFFCENCHKLLPATANGDETLCMDCRSLRSQIEKIKRSSAKPRAKKDTLPHNILFPFDSTRKGQEELMKNIYDTMASGKALVVHAPTGIGKTVSVLAPGLNFAKQNRKKIFFLTSRHTQHRIAIDTLRAIKERHDVNFSVIDIISKHRMCPREHEFRNMSYSLFNEMCNIEIKRRTCEYFIKNNKEVSDVLGAKILHAEELVELCKSKGLCPYKLAMELGADANVIICDYNYIFSDINETILPKLGVKLEDIIVIVDEAHNLPDRIRAHLTYELTLYKLASIIKGLKAKDRFLGRLMADISAMIEKELASVPDGKEMLIPKTGFLQKLDAILHSSLDKPMDVKEFRDHLITKSADLPANSVTKSQLMNFVSFLEAWELSDKSSIRYAVSDFEGTKLVVKILDPAVFSQPIFKSVASGILMSGTLYPPEMYADILGLDRNNTNFAKYSSPFLEENRLVTIDKSVTTSYAQRNLDMYYKIAVQIHRTAELVPGNVAVFFTSYDLLNSISKLLEQHPLKKPVLMERRELSAKAKSGILRELQVQKSEGEGALLLAVMGGSMAEGVDYPGNLLSGIMVVGIPLAPPSLELSALSSYFGGKFGDDKRDDYCSNLPAMNKVLQAAGRSIRSETDKSIIIFMDRRFNMQKYRKYFPDEYRITGDDFGSILKDFF